MQRLRLVPPLAATAVLLLLATVSCGEAGDQVTESATDSGSTSDTTTTSDGGTTTAAESTDAASSSAAESTGTGSSTDADTDDSSSTDESSSTSEGPPIDAGIILDRVSLNQGAGIVLANEGEPVDTTDSAGLVAQRPMLVRATWSLSDDWVARDMEARLVLTQSDGSEETLVDSRLVDGEPALDEPEGTFRWELTAEQVRSGLQLGVELVDPSLGDDAVVSTVPSNGGAVPLEIPDLPFVMEVVLVPIAYDDGLGCETVGDTSEATVTALHDALYQQNPVSALEIQVRDPISVAGPIGFSGAFDVLMQLNEARSNDGAAPQVFYYGLVDTCDPDPDFTGVANGIPTDPTAPGAQFDRTALGIWQDVDATAQIFVHEMGHSQGRAHVLCPDAVVSGADPNYPDHPNGTVLEWGHGLVDGQLRDPGVRDYMTYCEDQWVGAYGWNITHATQQALAETYGGGQAAPSPEFEVLIGMIPASGPARWSVVPSAVDFSATGPEGTVELQLRGKTISRPGAVHQIADGDAMFVVAAPPVGGLKADELSELELRHWSPRR